jgi:hypothetical protein
MAIRALVEELKALQEEGEDGEFKAGAPLSAFLKANSHLPRLTIRPAKGSDGKDYGPRAFWQLDGVSNSKALADTLKMLTQAGFVSPSKGKFAGSGELGLHMKTHDGGKVFASFRQKVSMGQPTTYVSIEPVQ